MMKEKIPYMIGYAGHGAIGMLDSFFNKQDDIKIVWPRIETACGFMADAYFRVTKQPLPVYVSTGPGPALSTCAVANAFYDSSAFLQFTGQAPLSQFDTGALQEQYRYHQADFSTAIQPYVKQSYQAVTAGQLSSFLPKAFKLMKTGRPGPVHIEVPYDVYQLEAETVVADPIDWSDSIAWRTGAEDRVIGSILQKLKEEIPAFLFFLTQRELSTEKESRMWFNPKLTHTAALQKIIRSNRNRLEIEMAELFLDIMSNMNVESVSFCLNDLMTLLIYSQVKAEKHQVRKVVQEVWKLTSAPNSLSYTAYEIAPHRDCHYETKRKTGRFYTITKEQLTAI